MIVEVERRESSSAGHAPHHLQGSVEHSEVSLEDPCDWVDERVLLRWRGGVPLPAVRKIITLPPPPPTHMSVSEYEVTLIQRCWDKE